MITLASLLALSVSYRPVGLVGAEMIDNGVLIHCWNLISAGPNSLRTRTRWEIKISGFTLTNPHTYYVQMSPDGRTLVLYGKRDEKSAVAIVPLDSKRAPRVFDFDADGKVRWGTKGGKQVCAIPGRNRDCLITFDGSSLATYQVPTFSQLFWSRDGNSVSFFGGTADHPTSFEVRVGTTTPKPQSFDAGLKSVFHLAAAKAKALFVNPHVYIDVSSKQDAFLAVDRAGSTIKGKSAFRDLLLNSSGQATIDRQSSDGNGPHAEEVLDANTVGYLSTTSVFKNDRKYEKSGLIAATYNAPTRSKHWWLIQGYTSQATYVIWSK